MKITILRPTSVYGTGLSNDSLISIFLKKALNDDTISLSEANNKINFIHAMDVAYASLSAYQQSTYGVFNIAAKEMTSIYDLVNITIATVGTGQIGKIYNVDEPFERFDLNCDYAKNKFKFDSKINIKNGISAMYNNKYSLTI